MPVNPRSLANLIPFKEGTTGNPNGRPRKLPELDALLAEVLGTEGSNGMTAAQGILVAMVREAMKGDVQAAALLLDRAYGKMKTTTDLTITEHTFNVVVEDEDEDDDQSAEVEQDDK